MNVTLPETTTSTAFSNGLPTSILTVNNSNYTVNSNTTLHISAIPAAAELTFHASNITIQLNKKLNWFQRMCYNALGFEYKTL